MKYIEQKVTYCSDCKNKTIHQRNNSKSSGFAIFVHLILTIATVGLWLVPLLIYKALFVKVGGWSCSEH